jgi:6-phosphogluconolactonase
LKPEINIYNSSEELFNKTAERVVNIINEYIEKEDRCTLVLAGGNTPKQLYDNIVKDYSDKVDWDKVYFFWGDERCVPPDDEESNYVMAYYHLLTGLKVGFRNVFRIKGEDPPGVAAQNYDNLLRRFFQSSLPSFDLVLLGVGTDGHTASLFPESKALNVIDKLAEADYYEKYETWRVTLTLPVINNAHNIFFLAEGNTKAEIIKKIFSDKKLNLPAQLVNPAEGNLSWNIDKEAGKLL